MLKFKQGNKRYNASWRVSRMEKASGYHRRSLVENAFYRWRTIFSDYLKSRKEETQYIEQK